MSLLIRPINYPVLDGRPTDKDRLETEIVNAIRAQQIEQLKLLIDEYEETFGQIDFQNGDGSTPLMLAACEGYLEGVSFLLSRKASITKTNKYGFTVAHYAVYAQNRELIDLLRQAGADFGQLSSLGKTPELIARQINNLDIQKHLKQTDTLAHAFSKELRQRKRLAHILEIKGKTTLAHPSRKRIDQVSYPLEEWHPSDFWNTLAKRTKAFFATKTADSLPSGIMSEVVVELCLQTAKNKPHEQLQRYSEHLPIGINYGYNGHHSTVLLWGSLAVLCDRALSSTGFLVLQIDPKKIDEALIQQIIQMKSEDSTTYAACALKVFEPYLAAVNSPLIAFLNAHMQLSRQTVGNCSWANSEAALYALFVLQSAKQHARSQMSVEEICKTQKMLFDEFRTFVIRVDADKYLTRHLGEKPRNRPYYPPEANFLRLIRPKLPVDLTRKVDKLL